MSGLKIKRMVWTVVFLGVTFAAIVMECVAGWWHPAGTIPWTEYLARYVPWPFQLAAYVILAAWLPFHFWRHDHIRTAAYHEGHADALGQVRALTQARRVNREVFLNDEDPPNVDGLLMPGEDVRLGPWPGEDAR